MEGINKTQRKKKKKAVCEYVDLCEFPDCFHYGEHIANDSCNYPCLKIPHIEGRMCTLCD